MKDDPGGEKCIAFSTPAPAGTTSTQWVDSIEHSRSAAETIRNAIALQACFPLLESACDG